MIGFVLTMKWSREPQERIFDHDCQIGENPKTIETIDIVDRGGLGAIWGNVCIREVIAKWPGQGTCEVKSLVQLMDGHAVERALRGLER